MLSFQEQIQGPENGSIARFDGLDCYQMGSEKSSRPAQLAAFRKPRRSVRASGGQTARPKHKVPDSGGALALLDSRPPLSFQEQIQGPENGSIARFDGLDCYQTRSE